MNCFRSIQLCSLTGVALILGACGGGNNSDQTPQPEASAVSIIAEPTPSNSAASAPETLAAAGSPEPVQLEASILAVRASSPVSTISTTSMAAVASTTTTSAGYYVDAVSGNDANTGSSTRPFKTLSRLKSLKLKANEGIFLRCGSLWRESFVLDATQLVDGTQITSYGNDCTSKNKPVISGANNFSGGWKKSGNIWSKAVPANTPKISRLFINKTPLRVAQWPNSAAAVSPEAANRSIASTSDSIRITREALTNLQGKDIKDVVIQIRTEPWMIESKRVRSQQANEFLLDTKTNFNINIGENFVLQDKLWMLDEPGEFFHDTVNSNLHFFLPKEFELVDPNTLTVEGSVRDTAIVLSGRKAITLKNVSAEMARTDGIIVSYAPASTIDAVTSSFNAWAGVRVNNALMPEPGTNSIYLTNSLFYDNSLSGIDVANSVRANVSGNTVIRTGHNQAEWSNAGIVGGNGAVITGNVVEKTGFRGIQFLGTGDSQVANNTVKEFCLQLSDCGAIYTYTHVARSNLPAKTFVTNNLIEGSSSESRDPPHGAIIAGIYIDDNSQNMVVQGNTIHSTNIGLYLHNGSNSTFERNSIWRTRAVGILAVMDRTDTNKMKGNIFRYNEIAPFTSAKDSPSGIPKFESSVPIRFLHATNGTNSIVMRENIFSKNKILSLTRGTNTATEAGYFSAEAQYSNHAWTQLNSEIPEVTPPAQFSNWKPTLGPERMFNGGFSRGLGSWSSWFLVSAPQYSVTAEDGISGCDGQCARMISSSPGDILSSPHFQLTKGSRYQVTFTASFFGMGDISHPDIARPIAPYDSYIDMPGLSSVNTTLSGRAGEKLHYEAAFTASASARSRMNLKINTPNVPVSFDSVSLKEILSYKVAAFSEWGAVIFAPPASSKTVHCRDLGWPLDCQVSDIYGNPLAMPVVVKQGSAQFLVLTNSQWKL